MIRSSAAASARELGYEPVVLSDCLTCEAREAGSFLASVARYHRDVDHSLAFIAGGETVVHLTGDGKGGRNQELALAAARLDDLSPLAVLARGFSIARDGSGAVVRSVEAVAPGDALAVTVADGELDCLIRASRATTSVEPWKES